MRRWVHLLLSSILCSASFGSKTMGWNSAGHMTVALVAYDQMDEATRSQTVALIRAHPRFHDHFESAMPREVSRADTPEQDEWLIAYASTWPDVVREAKGGVNRQDERTYSRPWWHFIDEPIYLNDDERQQLEHHLGVNRNHKTPDDRDDKDMNIIQAVNNSARIVSDKSARKEDRSVHLCWILHLVGDAHQPCHSSALFTTHRFRGGDHGANYLEIEHGWKLHGFWDDQISTEDPYKTIRTLATDLGQNRRLAEDGRKAAKSLDVGKWIDESHELAKKHVYTKEVLQKVSAREGHPHLGPLDLSAAYKVEAETVSERRAVEAGYRLAATITQMLR
jgi:hypothetical protein